MPVLPTSLSLPAASLANQAISPPSIIARSNAQLIPPPIPANNETQTSHPTAIVSVTDNNNNKPKTPFSNLNLLASDSESTKDKVVTTNVYKSASPPTIERDWSEDCAENVERCVVWPDHTTTQTEDHTKTDGCYPQ